MRTIIRLIIILLILATPVCAMDFTAPEAPNTQYMPADTQSFSEGVWYVIKSALLDIGPYFTEASEVCLSIIAVMLIVSIANNFSGAPKKFIALITAVCIGTVLLKPSNSLINLGVQTIEELTQYNKLLIPVMAASLAAQGAVTTSAALYAGTAIFSTVLGTIVSGLIVPMIYIFLCLCVANSALGENLLKNLKGFVKWLMTWSLKIVLYVFTGYLGITGVVSGATDAAAIKATKLAISGFVPVVGGILSDASESILVSAGVMRSAAGIYGVLAMLALCAGPFLQIAVQYLLLKLSSAICGVFGVKQASGLLEDFTAVMGFVLAMTGSVCLFLLISTVCFMKGVS